jgi:hypothetical protein
LVGRSRTNLGFQKKQDCGHNRSMKTNYPAAILANFNGDYQRAYEHLSRQYLALDRQFCDSIASRFLEIGRFEEDSEIYVHKKTESQISSDVADCIDPGVMRKWFYVDDNGSLNP